jgi:hypothetical protein
MDFVSDSSDFILHFNRIINFGLKSAREETSHRFHPKNSLVSVEISDKRIERLDLVYRVNGSFSRHVQLCIVFAEGPEWSGFV